MGTPNQFRAELVYYNEEGRKVKKIIYGSSKEEVAERVRSYIDEKGIPSWDFNYCYIHCGLKVVAKIDCNGQITLDYWRD